jgi:hypothetical protein
MISFVLIVAILAILYYSSQADGEKELRKRIETEKKSEITSLNQELIKINNSSKVKELIDKIKDNEGDTIIIMSERSRSKYNPTDKLIVDEFEKDVALTTIIRTETDKFRKNYIITEKNYIFQPDLEISCLISNRENFNTHNDKLIFENLDDTTFKEIYDKFSKMIDGIISKTNS